MELIVRIIVVALVTPNVILHATLFVEILVQVSVMDVTPLVQEVVLDVMDVPDVVGVTVMLVVQDATVALEFQQMVDILVVDVEDVREVALQDVVLNVAEDVKMIAKVLVGVIVSRDV